MCRRVDATAATPHSVAAWLWGATTRAITSTRFLSFSMLLVSLLSACVADPSFREDLQAAAGLSITALCILSMAFIPPKPRGSATVLGALVPGPHLCPMLLLGAWIVMFTPQSPPDHTLSLEIVVIAFATFVYQLFFATHGFPRTTRLGAFAIAMVVHTLHPLYSIGWREPFLIGVGSVTGMLCGAAIVNDARVIELASTNRRADSRLNHIIKGQCGGAAALLAALIETRREQGEPASTSDAQFLESLVEIHRMLEQASEWCHKREMFLQLEDGSYTTTMTEVSLRDELEGMMGPRAQVTADDVVSLDRTVMRLLVQEVADNATKYSPPGSTIRVNASLQAEETRHSVHLAISNLNCHGVPHLSVAECELIFKRGYRRRFSSSSCSDLRSDGLGLSSVKLAAEAVGGRVAMEADQQRTTVHIILPAARVDNECFKGDCTKLLSTPESAVDSSADTLDARLEDASQPAENPAILAPVSSQSPVGHTRSAEATTRTKQSSLVLEHLSDENFPSPVCIGIDDSAMLRKAQSALFRVFLKADPERSISIGASVDEADAFVDIAMGTRTISLEPANLPPADIVVLDQHIDYDDHIHCKKGSQLAAELRSRGFKGVICILTGSSQEEMVKLSRLPSVDFAFSKSMSPMDIARALWTAHKTNKARSPSSR